MFALALGTYAMRASAPLFLGTRQLPLLAERIVALVAVVADRGPRRDLDVRARDVAAARFSRRGGRGRRDRRLARCVEGSERVRIEIRDKASGIVSGFVNLTYPTDYDIDYSAQPRAAEPLPSTATDNLLYAAPI